MNKELKSDIILSATLVSIALIILWVLIPNQISVPPSLRGKYLSPAFAPRVFTVFLLVMALALLIRSIVQLKGRTMKAHHAPVEHVPTGSESAGKRHTISLLLWIAFCIFLYAVHLIGILLPSILFLGIVMVYFGQKRWGLVVTVMILTPIVLYLFFHELAKINFPKGILFI
jgi:putative tricarboxylic transport membrane protein